MRPLLLPSSRSTTMAKSIVKSKFIFYLISFKRAIFKLIFLFLIFRLRFGLLNWGDKFSAQEVKDAFDNMEIDKKGMIDTEDLISMVLGSGDDE